MPGAAHLLLLGAVLLSASAACGATRIADGLLGFYDLERYRIHRSTDLPSGGILPLPDPPQSGGRPILRGAAWRIDAAKARRPTAEEEGDGATICEGTRSRVEADILWPLGRGFRVATAGRLLTGGCGAWESAWLERNLAWSSSSVEILVGAARSFWGDGSEGSLLLGRTAPPHEMVRLRSVRPWVLPRTRSLGRFHGSIFLAYLDDAHRRIPYPLLQGTRLEWEPVSWARLSASRTILMGGAGRTEKLKGGDLWDIWWARDENRRGARDHSDTDQKASFGIEMRLPRMGGAPPWLRGARLFYEYAGEDAFKGPLPTAVAHQMGGAIDLADWIILGEVAETVDDANYWYTNHTVYGPGSYYYHGYVMGHPMGPDGVSAHLRIASPSLGGNSLLLWLRGRKHVDRRSEAGSWWEEGLGCHLGRAIGDNARFEIGVESFRRGSSGAESQDPPIRWRGSLGVRLGASPRPH
ncbi:MAG: capsule assembly Wzi family protein [Candidatus Eisenbacteria bacterium]|nr:capsule assembly Wzi family protein [Candidatus Eisenbacteria bacterium]